MQRAKIGGGRRRVRRRPVKPKNIKKCQQCTECGQAFRSKAKVEEHVGECWDGSFKFLGDTTIQISKPIWARPPHKCSATNVTLNCEDKRIARAWFDARVRHGDRLCHNLVEMDEAYTRAFRRKLEPKAFSQPLWCDDSAYNLARYVSIKKDEASAKRAEARLRLANLRAADAKRKGEALRATIDGMLGAECKK